MGGAKIEAWAVMTVASLLAFFDPAEAGALLDRVQSAVAAVIKIVTRLDLQGPTHLVAGRALLREVAVDFFDFPATARSSLGYHSATPGAGRVPRALHGPPGAFLRDDDRELCR
jgi:hypothetical protein